MRRSMRLEEVTDFLKRLVDEKAVKWHFHGNSVRFDGAQAVVSALTCNYSVLELVLDGLSPAFQRTVERFCQRNKDLADAKKFGRKTVAAVTVWDAADGEDVPLVVSTGPGKFPRLIRHKPGLLALALSGKYVATASGDGSLACCALDNGDCIDFVRPKGVVWTLAFSPTNAGHLVSGGEDGVVRLWDVARGTDPRRFEGHGHVVWAVAVSPDGRLIASGSGDKTVRLWDANVPNKCVYVFEGHGAGVFTVAFSPAGRYIASGSDDQTVRLWDYVAFSAAYTFLGHRGWVRCVAFSPDGKYLVSGGEDRVVRLWSAVAHTALNTFEGHEDWVRCVAFSPDGQHVASGGRDGTVRLWNWLGGPAVEVSEDPIQDVRALAFSPDGSALVTGSVDGTISAKGYGGITLQHIFEGTEDILSVAFSRDGTQMVGLSQDHTVRHWGLVDGAAGDACALTGGDGQGGDGAPTAFSADGDWIAAGCQDDTLCLWCLAAGPGAVWNSAEEHPGVTAVAVACNGAVIISGGEDRTVRRWTPGRGDTAATQLFRGHQQPVSAVAVSPGGALIVSGSQDQTVRLWRVDDEAGHVLWGHEGAVLSVAVSPDGRQVVSSGEDKTVRLWDVETRKSLHVWRSHATAHHVAFSPDGTFFVSSGQDQTICLWDIEHQMLPYLPNTPRLTLTLPRPVASVAVHPSGSHLAVGQGRFAVLLPLSTPSGPVLEIPDTELTAAPQLARHLAFRWVAHHNMEEEMGKLQELDAEVELCACDLFLRLAFESGMSEEVEKAFQHLTDAVTACNKQRSRPNGQVQGDPPEDGDTLLQFRLSYQLTKWMCEVGEKYPHQLLHLLNELPLLRVPEPQITHLAWEGNKETLVTLGSPHPHALPWDAVLKLRQHNEGKPTKAVEHCIIPLPHVAKAGGCGSRCGRLSQGLAPKSSQVAPGAEDDRLVFSFQPGDAAFTLGPSPGDPYFLRILVETSSVDLFDTIYVQAIVNHKWNKYARRKFTILIINSLCALVLQVSFSILIPSLPVMDVVTRLSRPNCTTQEVAAIAIAAACNAILALEVAYEWRQLMESGDTGAGTETPGLHLDHQPPQPPTASPSPLKYLQHVLEVPVAEAGPGRPAKGPPTSNLGAGPKASIACSEVASTWVRPRHPQRKVSWAARFQGLNQDKSAYVHVVTIVLRALAINGWLAGADWAVPVLAVILYIRWYGLYFFLQPFESTGPLIAMIYLIAVEIKGFLLVLLLTVLAGGNAFYLLVPRAASCDAANADACSAAPYKDVWDALFRMFNMVILINYDPADFQRGPYWVLLQVLFILNMILVPIILLNLLIALMGSSYGKIASQSSRELCLLRARLVLEVERTLLTKADKENEEWFPAFLHVIIPKGGSNAVQETAEEKMEHVKSRVDELNATLEEQRARLEEQGAKLRDMEARLEEQGVRVERKLDTLEALLQQVLNAQLAQSKAQ